MNSHIQMPKFVLRRFENEDHKLFFYDVRTEIIASGFANSINTEKGYYSPEAEDLLNTIVEGPFSRILKYLERIDYDADSITLSPDFLNTVKTYLNALLVRSPKTFQSATDISVSMQFFPIQQQHDMTVLAGLDEAREKDYFRDFFPTFMNNITDVPFVLPVCGFYWFVRDGAQHINIPIDPHTAITLVENKLLDKIIKNDKIRMYRVDNEKVLNSLNCRAMMEQKNLGYGRVVSRDKGTLELIKELCALDEEKEVKKDDGLSR